MFIYGKVSQTTTFQSSLLKLCGCHCMHFANNEDIPFFGQSFKFQKCFLSLSRILMRMCCLWWDFMKETRATGLQMSLLDSLVTHSEDLLFSVTILCCKSIIHSECFHMLTLFKPQTVFYFFGIFCEWPTQRAAYSGKKKIGGFEDFARYQSPSQTEWRTCIFNSLQRFSTGFRSRL